MNGYERDLQVFLSCEKQENQEAVSRSQLERV